eukprot:1161864-Pelagomonas_calceolata.AAC.10
MHAWTCSAQHVTQAKRPASMRSAFLPLPTLHAFQEARAHTYTQCLAHAERIACGVDASTTKSGNAPLAPTAAAALAASRAGAPYVTHALRHLCHSCVISLAASRAGVPFFTFALSFSCNTCFMPLAANRASAPYVTHTLHYSCHSCVMPLAAAGAGVPYVTRGGRIAIARCDPLTRQLPACMLGSMGPCWLIAA